eukprot:2157483-Prymnesium_polylepis.4
MHRNVLNMVVAVLGTRMKVISSVSGSAFRNPLVTAARRVRCLGFNTRTAARLVPREAMTGRLFPSCCCATSLPAYATATRRRRTMGQHDTSTNRFSYEPKQAPGMAMSIPKCAIYSRRCSKRLESSIPSGTLTSKTTGTAVRHWYMPILLQQLLVRFGATAPSPRPRRGDAAHGQKKEKENAVEQSGVDGDIATIVASCVEGVEILAACVAQLAAGAAVATLAISIAIIARKHATLTRGPILCAVL